MTDDRRKPSGEIESKGEGSLADDSLPSTVEDAELSYAPQNSSRTRSSAALSFAPGDLLANRFRILRFISRGGMGEVYEAEDIELHEHVAIKTVLPSIAANPAAIDRFKREIQLARKVTHPNVCRIFDLVYDPRPSGPIAFLSMELLNGKTLAQHIEKTGGIAVDEVLRLARQMAEGLDAAHSAGIIHQDFKSSNVILVDSGNGGQLRAVITDFGLAHNLRAPEGGTGRHGGTPAYMAPEQIEGRPLTAATDIYAFGVVLYEMVTGRWPHNAKTADELLSRKLSVAPVPPSKFVPDLPLRIERPILRCLARSPAERFQNANEAVTAMEPPRRRWPLASAAALVLIVLGVVAGLEWRKARRMMSEPTVAVIGFRNDTGNANYDWLATELAENLTTDLAGQKGIHSVSTDEVASVKTELSVGQNQTLEHEDLSSVREALGANYLLLGNYALDKNSAEQNLNLEVRLQDSAGNIVADVHERGGETDYRKLIASAASQIRGKLGTTRLSDVEVSELQNLYPSDPEASQLYFQGLDKLRAFDPTTALGLLKRAAERDPANVSIHWGLSDAWAQLKHDPEAAQEAQKAAQLAGAAALPQEYIVLAQARAAEMNKQWDAAIENYQALFRLFPHHLDYGLRLASAQTEGSRPTDALTTLATLARLPPPMGSDPRIEMAKAKVYGTMNDYKAELQSAGIALQEAQKRNARMMQARAQLELCWAHRNLGHVDEAYAACNQAQNLFSVFGDNVSAAVALNDVATWLSDRGNYNQAKDLYDRVIQVNQTAGAKKDLAGAYVNAAKTLVLMGKPADAEGYVQRAMDAAKETGDKYDETIALIVRANIRAKQGDLNSAQREIQNALNAAKAAGNFPLETAALSNLASYQAETNTEAALNTYRDVLSRRRSSNEPAAVATTLTNMGDVLLRRADLEAAEKNYQEALQIDTQLKDKNAIAHDSLSLASLELEHGRFADAASKAEQAGKEFHDDQDADSESAASSIAVKALVAQGKIQEADPLVKRIQEIATKDQETAFGNALSRALYLEATGKRSEAAQQLEGLAADAERAGMNFVSLEARLERVKIQRAQGISTELRHELSAIRSEAARAGFHLLIQRARALSL